MIFFLFHTKLFPGNCFIRISVEHIINFELHFKYTITLTIAYIKILLYDLYIKKINSQCRMIQFQYYHSNYYFLKYFIFKKYYFCYQYIRSGIRTFTICTPYLSHMLYICIDLLMVAQVLESEGLQSSPIYGCMLKKYKQYCKIWLMNILTWHIINY